MKDAIIAGEQKITPELASLLSAIYVERALQQEWFIRGKTNLNELKERGEKLNVLYFVLKEKLRKLRKP